MGTEPVSPDAPGYIVAWKLKYGFSAGKLIDEIMSYSQACARAGTLGEQHPEKTFWAERASAELTNRFYNPSAH